MEYRVCRNNPAPYNDLNGKISLLGLGTMRLPLRDAADQTSIDEEKAQEIFDYAYAHGVNYFDTAYPYHGGMSEKFCGKALAKYPRASYHLASKLPGWLLRMCPVFLTSSWPTAALITLIFTSFTLCMKAAGPITSSTTPMTS